MQKIKGTLSALGLSARAILLEELSQRKQSSWMGQSLNVVCRCSNYEGTFLSTSLQPTLQA